MKKYFIESVIYDSKDELANIESSDIIFETNDKQEANEQWKIEKEAGKVYLNKGFGYAFYERITDDYNELIEEVNYYTYH